MYAYPLAPVIDMDPLGLNVQSALGPFINSPGIQSVVTNAMSSDRLNINPSTYEILNSTYNDMKRLNFRESDQFFHCSAFCRVSKSNNSNKTWASTLGGIKEIRDYMLNTFGLYGSGKLSDREMIQDNIEDLKVNQHGLSCPSQQNCSDRCSKYLNQDHKDTMNVLKNEGYLE
ncbi:TPA: RHS repeat-associated core domain-containing protein [Kluyvera intermedia]|nr:RHS repeat-associated core domain-containing protein [Kluyvera intermedia]